MANALDALIDRIPDEALRGQIREALKKQNQQKKFGLVFEDHIPESTVLYDVPVKAGSTVALRGGDVSKQMKVLAIDGEVAHCLSLPEREPVDQPLDSLVSVAKFGEPIYPYLKQLDTVCNAPDSDLWHTLIEADNYHALQLLEYLYAEKIDCIYIDPPYNNRAKTWKYNNDYVDGNDAYRHSKWLSFMEQRLLCSSRLLKNNGIIMISIDDRELFNLKVLCDDVFGEQNFVSCFSCQSNPGGDKSDYIEGTLQYVLVYSKNKNSITDFGMNEQIESADYKLKDSLGYYKKGGQLEKWGNDDTTHTHPNLAYSIYYNPQTGDVKHLFDYNQEEINADRTLRIKYEEPNEKLISDGYVCIRPRITNAGENGRWRLEPETFYKRLHDNGFIFQSTKNGYKIYEKDRIIESRFVKAKNFIPATVAKQESKELLSIFGSKVFDYPKPLSLMTYLIGIVPQSDITVLDFFAGSGTTGHAVMKLNAEDGGSRKFILCTNNENNICRDVTYERIKRVIAKENYKASLKYFKVDYLPISDKLYYEYADELLLHIRELVELENGINFNGNAEIAIVLTEAELDDFTQNIPETCKAIYVGHDVLPTEEQEKIFAKRKIKIKVIPEYYYRDLEG